VKRSTSFVPTLAPAAVLLMASMAAAQSLGDLARTEQARRQSVKSSGKVYTNTTLQSAGSESPAPPSPPAAKATPPKAPATTTPAAMSSPPASDRSKDEKYWRDRITAGRAAVQRSQAFFDALQSQINGLYAEFVAMGDPVQRGRIEKKRTEAMAEQGRVKADIAQQTKEIAAIEDEARRASVPAGWLR
jgi:hypothetical protein